ncbi:MAG: oligosaccharide flippase family protein, partial [Dehalococcoidia bacterium]
MQEQGGSRGSFFFNVNLVFLSQIATYGLAFGLRIVLARGLGDEGLGTYALFFLAVIVAGGIVNLGIGLGNIYFLNKGPHSSRVLLANSLSVLAVTSVLTWLMIAAYGLIAEPQFLVSGRTFWLYAAALPSVVGYVLLTSFLHGSSRFLALTAVATAQGLSGLLMVAGLYAFDALDVFSALAAWAGSFILADLLALAVIGVRHVDIGGVLRPNWGALKDQVR